ncbi:MAG: substrate-binding periplasmic protein [Gammaproteobacteria bacterium]
MSQLRLPLLILLLSLTIITSSASAAKVLKMATSHWSPYVDKKLPKSGLAMDIMTSVFQKAGYKLDISYEKWSRTLEGAQIGIYDAVATAWYSDKRAKSFAYTDAYLNNELKFLVRSDSTMKFTSYNDLQDRLIGVVKDYAYGGDFMKARNFMRLQANQNFQNIDLVFKKQIDAAIADERVFIYKINSVLPNSKSQFKILPIPVSINSLHVAVSKANPQYKEIVAAFNKALITMKDDGSYLKILKSHESNELKW